MGLTLHYSAILALSLMFIHCKGVMREQYDLFQEATSKLEQQLAEADEQFNEVQANFRNAINEIIADQARFQEIGNDLAVQNSKIAQVDAKLELVANLKMSEFEEKDTVLFTDLEKIDNTLNDIRDELERIATQIEQIKK